MHVNTNNRISSPVAQIARPSAAITNAETAPAPDSVQQLFKQQFGSLAKDPRQFHELLQKSFGDRFDRVGAENLRQRALSGDYSWLPRVEYASDAAMNGGLGAYDAKSGVIYLHESLRNDPALAQSVFVEEAGHHLDAKLNTSDTAGDEGEVFRRLMAGENLSDAALRRIRQTNDAGTVTINGKAIEVENFKIGKIFKSIGNAIGGAVKGIGNAVGKVAGFVGKGVGAVTGFIQKGVSGIGKILRPFANALKPIWSVVQKVLPFALPVLSAVFPPLGALGGALGGILGKVGGAVLGKVGGFLGPILGKAGGLLGKVTGFISPFVNKVSSFLGPFANKVTGLLGKLNNLRDKAPGFLKPLADRVSNLAKPWLERASKWIDPIRNWFGGAEKAVATIDDVRKIINNINNAATRNVPAPAARALNPNDFLTYPEEWNRLVETVRAIEQFAAASSNQQK